MNVGCLTVINNLSLKYSAIFNILSIINIIIKTSKHALQSTSTRSGVEFDRILLISSVILQSGREVGCKLFSDYSFLIAGESIYALRGREYIAGCASDDEQERGRRAAGDGRAGDAERVERGG